MPASSFQNITCSHLLSHGACWLLHSSFFSIGLAGFYVSRMVIQRAVWQAIGQISRLVPSVGRAPILVWLDSKTEFCNYDLNWMAFGQSLWWCYSIDILVCWKSILGLIWTFFSIHHRTDSEEIEWVRFCGHLSSAFAVALIILQLSTVVGL